MRILGYDSVLMQHVQRLIINAVYRNRKTQLTGAAYGKVNQSPLTPVGQPCCSQIISTNNLTPAPLAERSHIGRHILLTRPVHGGSHIQEIWNSQKLFESGVGQGNCE